MIMTDEELKEQIAQALRDFMMSQQWDYEGEQEEQIQGIVEAIFKMVSYIVAREIAKVENND